MAEPGERQRVSAAGSASRAAFPGGARALQGVEDHVVDDGAVGAAQGHSHGLRARGRAARTLVRHILRVDGVQGFAGASSLQRERERGGDAGDAESQSGEGSGAARFLHLPSSRPGLRRRNPGQPGNVSERPALMELSHPAL